MKRSALHRWTAALCAAVLCVPAVPQRIASADSVSAVTVAASTDAVEDTIRNAWERHSSTISLLNYRLTLDDVCDIYYRLLYTDSKWFYISSSFYYSTVTMGGRNYISSISVRYNYDTSKISQMQREMESKIAEITAGVHPEWTQAEIVLYFHDTLIANCEYDFTYTYGDAYSALCGGSSICQGLGLAMNLLCREVGIPCYAITSDELNHMWNVVQVDGKWYHLDLTNDDYSPNMIGHALHSFVLCSDDYAMNDVNHAASDWNYFADGNTIVCDSDLYENAFWVNAIDTLEPLPDGSFIYAQSVSGNSADSIGATFLRGSLRETPVPVGSVKAYWKTSDNWIYSRCFTCSDVYGDRLYYHTAKAIYSIPVTGGSAELLYTLSAEEQASGSCYGIQIDDSTHTLYYQITDRADFEDPDVPKVVCIINSLPLPAATPETTTTETSTTTTTTTTSTTMTTSTTTTSTSTTTSTTTTSTTTTTPTTTTITSTTTTTPTTTSTTTTTTSTTTTTTSTSTSTSTTATSTTTTTPTTTTLTSTTTSATTTTPTATTTTSTTTTTTTTLPVIVMTLCGDADCNGEVDVRDAVLIARAVANDITLTQDDFSDQGKCNSDCTRDGIFDVEDLKWLLRFLARQI